MEIMIKTLDIVKNILDQNKDLKKNDYLTNENIEVLQNSLGMIKNIKV